MSDDGRHVPDPAGHDHVALLTDAVHELRAIATRAGSPLPAEFAAMASARLLEEISRAIHAGSRCPQRVLDAAVEIARHTVSYSAQR